MKKTLVHGNVITPYRHIEDGRVVIDDEKICCVDRDDTDEGEVFDVSGLYVTPGFIDLHIHGGGGHEFWSDDHEQIIKAAQFHAGHGVTSLMPTVGIEGSIDFTDEHKSHFEAYDRAFRDGEPKPEFLGIHLEGPYVSDEFPLSEHKVIIMPVKQDYEKFLDFCPHIRKWTVAPEIPGAMDFISDLSSRGIYASIGHSSAEMDIVYEAFERGANQITHMYSGMTMTHRVDGLRLPGIVESSYLIDEIYAEVIGNGMHLSSELISYIYRFKGPGHICIVSDGSALTGTADGPIEYQGKKGIIRNGVIYKEDMQGFLGSVTTYDRMFYNLLYKAGIPVSDAVRMTSTSPANAIGCGNIKGKLAAGFDADVIAFDKEVNIKLVIAKGEVLYNDLLNSQ